MLFKSSYAGLGSFQNEYILNPSLVFFFLVFLFVLFYFQKGVFAQGVALEKILKGSASRLVNPRFHKLPWKLFPHGGFFLLTRRIQCIQFYRLYWSMLGIIFYSIFFNQAILFFSASFCLIVLSFFHFTVEAFLYPNAC